MNRLYDPVVRSTTKQAYPEAEIAGLEGDVDVLAIAARNAERAGVDYLPRPWPRRRPAVRGRFLRSGRVGTISACNVCHAGTGHPYVKIMRPTAPALDNVDWRGQ